MSLKSVHNNRKMLMGVLKEMYQDTYGDVWEDYFIEPAEIYGNCHDRKIEEEGRQTLKESEAYKFRWVRPF